MPERQGVICTHKGKAVRRKVTPRPRHNKPSQAGAAVPAKFEQARLFQRGEMSNFAQTSSRRRVYDDMRACCRHPADNISRRAFRAPFARGLNRSHNPTEATWI